MNHNSRLQPAVDAFKQSTRDQQAKLIAEAYANASKRILEISEQMQALNDITDHYQTMERVEGFTLPLDVQNAFRLFIDSSNEMSERWIMNQSILRAAFHWHGINAIKP